jgi:hypothetical protein
MNCVGSLFYVHSHAAPYGVLGCQHEDLLAFRGQALPAEEAFAPSLRQLLKAGSWT